MSRITDPQFLHEIRLARDKVDSFDRYPFCLNTVRHLSKLKLHPSVTFFVGENGSGKSTLLEAIASSWGFNAEGGSRNFNFSTHSGASRLASYIQLSKGIKRPSDGFFLRAESFFNVASEVDRLGVSASYGGKSLHDRSHGESFWTLFMERFRGNGLYLLDEPEAALSPTRQMAFISRLHDLVKQNSQFVIATHSPIIMAYPDAFIYLFGEKGIRKAAYTETEHYRVARNFLGNYETMLKTLMED